MEKEKEGVTDQVYDSFKGLVENDQAFREVFLSFPALAYYLYVAGGQLCNKQMDCSMSECLKQVLADLPEYEGKPTFEALEQDATGEIHMKLNDQLAPNAIMYLVSLVESKPVKQKRVVH